MFILKNQVNSLKCWEELKSTVLIKGERTAQHNIYRCYLNMHGCSWEHLEDTHWELGELVWNVLRNTVGTWGKCWKKNHWEPLGTCEGNTLGTGLEHHQLGCRHLAWLNTPSLREWVAGTWTPMLLWLNWWCLGCACQATADRRVGKWRGKFAKFDVVVTLEVTKRSIRDGGVETCEDFQFLVRRNSLSSQAFLFFFVIEPCVWIVSERNFVGKWVPFGPLFCGGFFFPWRSLC